MRRSILGKIFLFYLKLSREIVSSTTAQYFLDVRAFLGLDFFLLLEAHH